MELLEGKVQIWLGPRHLTDSLGLAAQVVGKDHPHIRFSKSDRGQPKTDLPGVACSISHSGDLWCLALARVSHLGVDLERVRTDLDFSSLGRNYFSPLEQERWQKSADPIAEFFKIWTEKEARLKSHGLGLNAPQESWTSPHFFGPDVATALPLPEGYVGHVVSNQGLAPVMRWFK